MEQRRGSHRAAGVNTHSIATDSMDSPRKGRKWSLTSTGSPEQEKETANNTRGFRLLSPKKALQLKKQAKARKRQEKEQKLESGEGSGGLMPIWEKTPQNRGAVVPPKRTEICLKPDQLNRIEDSSEGSAHSVGMDELFEAAQNGVDLSTSNARMHSTSPTRMQSGPQQMKLSHLSPRRSVSDGTDYQLPGEYYGSANFMDFSNQPDIIQPTSPLSRTASAGVHSQRINTLPRQTRRLDPQRSATGCEPMERRFSHQPDMILPPTSPLSRASSTGVHGQRAIPLPRPTRRPEHQKDGLSILALNSTKRRSQLQNSRPQKREDFHQSLSFMDIFDDTEQDAGGPPTNCDAVAAQEEEMMAMALEQSIRDVGGIPVPISPQSRPRNSLEKSKYEPEFERVVLRKSQDWKMTNKTKRDSLPAAAANCQNQDVDAEAIRIAEEEQEKEMIQLAMERSMAEVPAYSPPPRPRTHQRRVPANLPVHKSCDHRPHAPIQRTDADSDELERREQEMMARALEMSRNDF